MPDPTRVRITTDGRAVRVRDAEGRVYVVRPLSEKGEEAWRGPVPGGWDPNPDNASLFCDGEVFPRFGGVVPPEGASFL